MVVTGFVCRFVTTTFAHLPFGLYWNANVIPVGHEPPVVISAGCVSQVSVAGGVVVENKLTVSAGWRTSQYRAHSAAPSAE